MQFIILATILVLNCVVVHSNSPIDSDSLREIEEYNRQHGWTLSPKARAQAKQTELRAKLQARRESRARAKAEREARLKANRAKSNRAPKPIDNHEDSSELVMPSLPKLPKGALTIDDFIAGESTALNDLPANFVDPIPFSGKFEGDIDLRGRRIEYYVDNIIDDSPSARGKNNDVQHSAIKGQYYRWEDAVIPYSSSSSFSQRERAVIAAAISEYTKHTCIRWVPRTSQRNYVYFFKGSGCYSSVGRVGNRQTISLGQGCVLKGIVIHEMMHAAGFFHEQSRTDRDSYVTINWHNMYGGVEGNFRKLGVDRIDNLGTSYDYQSIMHYGAHYFSKNGEPTIVTRNSARIGQRNGFSSTDIVDLNRLYQCSSQGRGTRGSKTTPAPSPVSENCKDENQHCEYWAEYGECSRNPGYMLKYCKVSCRVEGCIDGGSAGTVCSNNHRYCDYWAKRGECSRSYRYMRVYCKRACKVCSS